MLGKSKGLSSKYRLKDRKYCYWTLIWQIIITWSSYLDTYSLTKSEHNSLQLYCIFYLDFLSRTLLAIYKNEGEMLETIFIPFKHLQPLTNIQKFICGNYLRCLFLNFNCCEPNNQNFIQIDLCLSENQYLVDL